jgi:tight adherence protein C
MTAFAAASLINLEELLPLALFGMVAALAWWALELVAAGKPRAVERLAEIKNPRLRRNAAAEAMLKKSAKVSRVLEGTTALAKPLQPKNAAEAGKLKTRLANAGFRGEGATTVFLGLKFVGLLAGLFLGGGAVTTIKGFNQSSLMWTVGLIGFFFYLPDFTVSWIGKKRHQAIFLALPDALDLMVVCVEAGLGLDQAMRKVSDEMKRTYRVLSEEFALTNFQLQMGRTRADALHELGVRTGVSDLRALAGVLIQADKFGSSIAQALRVQSDSMRTRRRQLAEEKAAKTAVKLIFPLVLFIFPGIFVILVGPAAITMVREMFPKMTGR